MIFVEKIELKIIFSVSNFIFREIIVSKYFKVLNFLLKPIYL